MEKVKAFVNNFNLLTWPKAMVEWLLRFPRVEPIIIDNASTYPPLLSWYEHCPVQVVRLDDNQGHLAPWSCQAVWTMVGTRKSYIVTDPDIGLEGIPDDWLEKLEHGLTITSAARPTIFKCGFSLRTDDIADTPENAREKISQQAFWKTEVEPGYFVAPVDTTFALYRPGHGRRPLTPCLRVGPPYTARHLPWYFTLDNLTDEYRNYIKTANDSSLMARYMNEWMRSVAK